MGRRVALIIGNSQYDDPRLAGLVAPDVDVQGLSDVLKTPAIGGFDEVTELVQQGCASVRRAIAQFFRDRRRDDLLLLYFSGHGMKDDHGHLYLALRDTETDLLTGTAIEAAFITEQMDRSMSNRQVLMLDCCHSGAFSRGAKGAPDASAGIGPAFEGNGFGKVVLTATDSIQYAWERDRVHGTPVNSLFTHHLIEGLRTGDADRDRDGRIDLDELFDYVFEKVVSDTPKQRPQKWAYKQEGEIVIARSPRTAADPLELPDALRQAIESPLSRVREGAVRELSDMLAARDDRLVAAAYAALERLSKDDSRRVCAAATEVLGLHVQVSMAPGAATAVPEEGPRTEKPQGNPMDHSGGTRLIQQEVEATLAAAARERRAAPRPEPTRAEPAAAVARVGRRPLTGFVAGAAILVIAALLYWTYANQRNDGAGAVPAGNDVKTTAPSNPTPEPDPAAFEAKAERRGGNLIVPYPPAPKPLPSYLRLRTHVDGALSLKSARVWSGEAVPSYVALTEGTMELFLLDDTGGGKFAFYRDPYDASSCTLNGRTNCAFFARFYTRTGSVAWGRSLNQDLSRADHLEIQDIRYVDGVLYFNEACQSRSKEAQGKCSSLLAVNPASGVVWRSRPLVSHGRFAVLPRYIVSAGDESNYVYVINRADGSVEAQQSIPTEPRNINVLGDGVVEVIVSGATLNFRLEQSSDSRPRLVRVASL